MNVVMTGGGRFVELQGTAEGEPFARAELDALISLAERGIAELLRLQRQEDGEVAGRPVLPVAFVPMVQGG